MGGSKGGGGKVTVGYRYSWDIQAGLGRGPINEIVAITTDKKTVFAGYEGQLSSSTSIFIDKPNLFGGDDTGGEGGIQGVFEVAMGEADQVPTPNVLKLLSGLVPGFRGMVTTFFSGLISCYSASPKPWAYRNRRSTKGWDRDIVWYPEKCLIRLENTQAQIDGQDEMTPDVIANLRAIHAMNPAHILVECATNRDWGRGLLLSEDLDLDSYRYAADQLYAEGFGLCFRYNRQDSLDTFVQQMLDHIGAAQYGDLSTGKTTLKLIRDDYNPDDLPLFTYDNGIIAVQDDDSTSSDTAPNEITVTYHDPVTNSDGEVRAQNLGSIQSVGLISSSVEYKAIPTHDLAARVAQRDLEVGSAGITRLVIQFDRRGGQLTPASCFRVSLPDRNINNMVLRVSKIDEADTGALTITAVQDVFGLPATSYSSGQQGSGWTPPNKSAVPVSDLQLVELPYFSLAATLSAADLSFVSPEACYLGVMATAPTSFSVNYHLQSRAAGAEFADRGRGDWTATAVLLSEAGALDTELHVSMTFPPAVGSGVIIDNEVVRVDAVDLVTGKLMVGRGCADTLPRWHAANTLLRFLGSVVETDGQEYIPGELVDVRLLTRTSIATLDASLAPISSMQMNQRQFRPYVPGDIRVNGVSYPSVVERAGIYVLSYAHRDRVLQADRLFDCSEGSIGPEPGVAYTITLTHQDSSEVVWSLETTEASVELPYESAGIIAIGAAVHILTLSSTRDGIESLYRYQAILPRGWYIPVVPIEPPEPEDAP
ncbi:phage tail protein [Serratia fonticola]